jgi:hypothetical protein
MYLFIENSEKKRSQRFQRPTFLYYIYLLSGKYRILRNTFHD